MPKGVLYLSDDDDSQSEMKSDNADTKFVKLKEECKSDKNKKNDPEISLTPLKVQLCDVSKSSRRKYKLHETQNNVTPKHYSEVNNFSDSTETKESKQNDIPDVLSSKLVQDKKSTVKNSQFLPSNTKETFSQIVDQTSKLKVQLCDIFICTEENCVSNEVTKHRDALHNIEFLKGYAPNSDRKDKRNSSKKFIKKSGKTTGYSNKITKYVATTAKKANIQKIKYKRESNSSSESESNSERESSIESEASEADSDWDINSGISTFEEDDEDFLPSSKRRKVQVKKPSKKKTPPSKKKKAQIKKKPPASKNNKAKTKSLKTKTDSESENSSENESDSEAESSSKKKGKELSEYQKQIQKSRDEKMAFLKSLQIDQIKEDIKEAASKLKKPSKPKVIRPKEVLPLRKNPGRALKLKDANLSEDYINQKAYNDAHKELNNYLKEQRIKNAERVRKREWNKELKKIEQERKRKEKELKRKMCWFLTQKKITTETQLEEIAESDEFLNVDPEETISRRGQRERILERNKKIAMDVLLEWQKLKEVAAKRELQRKNVFNFLEMKKMQEMAKKQHIQPKISTIYQPQIPPQVVNTSKIFLQKVPAELIKSSTVCVSNCSQGMHSPVIYVLPKPSVEGMKPSEILYLPKAPETDKNAPKIFFLPKAPVEGVNPSLIPAEILKNSQISISLLNNNNPPKVINKSSETILSKVPAENIDSSKKIPQKAVSSSSPRRPRKAILPKTPVEVIDVSDSEKSDEAEAEKPNVADFLEVKYE